MVNVVRHSPLFSDVTRFDPFTNMDNWLKDFGKRPILSDMEAGSLIKVDLKESDTAYTIRAEVPGVNKDDIKVQVDGNRVSISAETKQNKKKRKRKVNELSGVNFIKVQVTEASTWIMM